VLLPLAGGCLVALGFAGTYGPAGRAPFVAFVGVAMAATAFPVLARILTDRGLATEPLGRLAMSAAAVTDVVTWTLLAAVIAGAATGGRWRVALVPVFVLVLAYGVRPLLARVLTGRGRARPGDAVTVPLLLAGLMLCCAVTEWLGVHYVFGAFSFGVVVARSAPAELRRRVVGRIESIGIELLLPVYFVTAGLQVDLSGVHAGILGVLAAVLAVAILTKTTGAYAGGRLAGLPGDDALRISVLMNTRGLTEIVVLTVGLRLGLVDDRFYSAMVVMAVLTTAMTGPLLTLIDRRRPPTGPAAVGTGAPEALYPQERRTHDDRARRR
jgi:Kef-type K+ transport system membrane component KefB